MNRYANRPMRKITVFHSEVSGNHIIYHFCVTPDLKQYFRSTDVFAIDWPFSIEDVPESVRIIPLLSQLLPVAWVGNIEIEAPCCDRDFYEALDAVKDGFRQMHPMLSFGGCLKVERLEDNNPPVECRGPLICYSGGLDSIDTILAHLNENPLLVSLWGSDIFWEKEEPWHLLESQLRKNADLLGLRMITLRTSFRKLLLEGPLTKLVSASGDNWWHGFQHGLGILGHLAPIAWKTGARLAYIAASFTAEFHFSCASDPLIDNHVRFCGTQVVHDGYDRNRQEKTRRIIAYCEKTSKPFPIHVCWKKQDVRNCCQCEKCWRTMLGFAAEGADPRMYGFPRYTGGKELQAILENNPAFLGKIAGPNYQPIQNQLLQLKDKGTCPEDLLWFCDLDLMELQKKNTAALQDPPKKTQPAAASGKRTAKWRTWACRKNLVHRFWETYGKKHTGWRKAYASFITEYTSSEETWKACCDELYRNLQTFHPESCRVFGLHRHRVQYYFCRAFLGAIPSDYFKCLMFRHGWGYRQGIVTNGKIRFIGKQLNSYTVACFYSNKVASAAYWDLWYKRGWAAVGPGHPVNREQLEKLLNGKNSLLLKPLNDYGGQEIKVLEIKSAADLQDTVSQLNRLDLPYILEERVGQTGLLHEISPSSVNTVRIISVRHRDGSISIENVSVRFGRSGSVVDSVSGGGCEFFVNSDSGCIAYGNDLAGRRYTTHPDTHQKVAGLYLPHYDEVKRFCTEAHLHGPEGLNLVEWAVCISGDQLSLIGVNESPAPVTNAFEYPSLWKRMKAVLDEYDQED